MRRSWIVAAAAFSTLLANGTSKVQAQEAIRMSLASAEAAEARRRAETTVGYHNLRLGPTAWSFSTGLGVTYTDNVWSAPPEFAIADVAVGPFINTRMLWPVSDRNSVSLALGGGYSFYLQNPEFSRYSINPGTEVSLDLYVGPLWIDVHDRVSIRQNTYQDPTAVGVVDYSRFENNLGFTALWDLNKIVLRLGYDHANYINLEGGQGGYPDGQAELMFGSIAYVLRPQMSAGIELGAGLVGYDVDEASSSYSEALQTSIGSFFDARITEYIKGRVSGGYSLFTPLNGLSEGQDYTGYYLQLGLTHRLNQYFEHSVTASKGVSFTFYGGTIDMYNLRWVGTWKVLKDIGMSTTFIYEHGSYPYGFDEVFDRFGPGLQLSKRLGEKISTTFGYTMYLRQSNLPNRSYTANIVTIAGHYRF